MKRVTGRGAFAAALLASVGLAGTASAAPTRLQYANDIVGQTSTATIAGGGNPLYIPPRPEYNGVVGLLMDYGADGAFVCSGSLVSRNYVLTAAHCVSDGGRGRPLSTTAFFYGGPDDPPVYSLPTPAGVVTANVDRYTVRRGYTGQVIDQNDIALLRLATDAPGFAPIYGLSGLDSLTGVEHIIAGYGVRSDTGGSVGNNLGVGRLRYAGNRFETRIGDPDFGGRWARDLSDGAAVDYVYMSDFDNGTDFRDQMCNIATGIYGLARSPKYCDLGIGAFEGIGGGGDSGAPYFVDGQIAAVHSFALWYREDESRNRFGQFKGAVPVYFHRDFIVGTIPEPGTPLMLLSALGLASLARRRSARAA